MAKVQKPHGCIGCALVVGIVVLCGFGVALQGELNKRRQLEQRRFLEQSHVNNTPGSTAERLGLIGTWVGKQNGNGASLFINSGENNLFSGTKTVGTWKIAFTGEMDPDSRRIVIRETRVIEGYNLTVGWALGAESGYLSNDQRHISGNGEDDRGTSYTWSYSKQTGGMDGVTPRPLNLDNYCRSKHGDSAVAVSTAGDAFGWRCMVEDLGHSKQYFEMNMDEACQMQYGSKFRAAVDDPKDFESWHCIPK